MARQNLTLGLLLLALVSTSIYLSLYKSQKNVLSQFEQWKLRYDIKYTSQFEESYRERVFLENRAIIELHNSNPLRTYNRGLNKFSAMTKEEFRSTYLTLQSNTVIRNSPSIEMIDNLKAGDIDWRKAGAVTPIKDQGHCGSCWSFSTTGGLEGLSKIATGTLQSFSEQQMMDCVTDNHGCHGGQMRRALLYVKDNGIVLESQYPYQAVQGTCQQPKGQFKLSGYTNISSCHQLANALTSQPIMVGIDSSNWHDYESGIFNNCPQQRGEFNHGVLVVGMTKDAWIIKNQWTAEWGEQGYMRMARGDTCNICDDGMLLHK